MVFSPPPAGFFPDELLLPWSITLAEAGARLPDQPRWPPYGGWLNLRLVGTHALSLAATGCNLRAPARARPGYSR